MHKTAPSPNLRCRTCPTTNISPTPGTQTSPYPPHPPLESICRHSPNHRYCLFWELKLSTQPKPQQIPDTPACKPVPETLPAMTQSKKFSRHFKFSCVLWSPSLQPPPDVPKSSRLPLSHPKPHAKTSHTSVPSHMLNLGPNHSLHPATLPHRSPPNTPQHQPQSHPKHPSSSPPQHST